MSLTAEASPFAGRGAWARGAAAGRLDGRRSTRGWRVCGEPRRRDDAAHGELLRRHAAPGPGAQRPLRDRLLLRPDPRHGAGAAAAGAQVRGGGGGERAASDGGRDATEGRAGKPPKPPPPTALGALAASAADHSSASGQSPDSEAQEPPSGASHTLDSTCPPCPTAEIQTSLRCQEDGIEDTLGGASKYETYGDLLWQYFSRAYPDNVARWYG